MLSDGEIREAIENTNVFLQVEEYDSPIFNKDIKMPSLYLDKPQEERDEIYKQLITVKRKPGIENIDVLVDGEYIDEYKSPDKHWVGSSNQNVIDVKASMKENKLVLWKEG